MARSTESGAVPGAHGRYVAAAPSVIVRGTGASRPSRRGQRPPLLRRRRGRVDRLAGRDREQVRPRPGYDLDQRVAAAAGGDPLAAAQFVGECLHREVAGPLTVHRQPQVGQRIETMCVGAALADQDLRSERAQHAGYDRVERTQPAVVADAGRQRDVDRAAVGARAAGLGRESGAREQRQRRLVQADRQHPRVVVEHGLYAVAVVHVDVDVRDALGAEFEQPPDRDGRVVVDAEAARRRRHRVVQAAGDVDRVHRLAGPHRLGGGHRSRRRSARSRRACRRNVGLSGVPRPYPRTRGSIDAALTTSR